MADVDADAYTTPFALTAHTRRDPYAAIASQANTAKGLIIIITGGGTGIGAAAAEVWARAGAEGIVITGRRSELLDGTVPRVASISPSTKVIGVQADSSSEGDVMGMYEQVQKTFGRCADVLLHNAGVSGSSLKIGEQSQAEWFKTIDINLKGTYLNLHHFIRCQPDPANPKGTVIAVSSGLAALTTPGFSAYSISKSSQQRLIEIAQLEYPSLRCFTSMPGIVETSMTSHKFRPFAKDHIDLTGLQALWLATVVRADFLKGAMVSVNWDVEELVAAKDEIVARRLLWTNWCAALPMYGGKGLGGV